MPREGENISPVGILMEKRLDADSIARLQRTLERREPAAGSLPSLFRALKLVQRLSGILFEDQGHS